MSITTSCRFVYFSLVMLAAPLWAAEQKGCTDADADAVKAFLRDNFAESNAGMVIGRSR